MSQALAEEPEVLTELTSLYGDSIALRRAETQRSLLDGARILWIDDHPESTTWERRVLESFGAAFVTVQSTASAVAVARADALISDIGRDTGESGLAGLPAVRDQPRCRSFLSPTSRAGVPPGAHGITNDPEDSFTSCSTSAGPS
jgi:CheY-like chemotaxis protein